jgi:tetrahydromethanopterin S-methyltransferase subunit E
MENIVFGIGITALTGALATVAGSAEDTESNIGSQGDPNSQVQLAPQMGFLHRIFNKAVAGEPPAYGLWCALGAGLAWAFMAMQVNAILAIVFLQSSFRASTQRLRTLAGQQVSPSSVNPCTWI